MGTWTQGSGLSSSTHRSSWCDCAAPAQAVNCSIASCPGPHRPGKNKSTELGDNFGTKKGREGRRGEDGALRALAWAVTAPRSAEPGVKGDPSFPGADVGGAGPRHACALTRARSGTFARTRTHTHTHTRTPLDQGEGSDSPGTRLGSAQLTGSARASSRQGGLRPAGRGYTGRVSDASLAEAQTAGSRGAQGVCKLA
ncbi:unnamed protein product [Rangifer tarandus platyrhynchus]|uniref:Uncharacterized protein n=1 Tax=Rangifer tarandus platyrhynchus TaxID=3082113 RepID=A0ABN8YWP1_RANTA|nr:unnamed protein product [Rangifer tarandus platyrhynchus]